MKKAILATGALCAVLLGGRFPAPGVDAACCYFAAQEKDINQPGQKAFISWDAAAKVEAFTVQPKFEGNAVDFGMVIPTPAKPKLDEMPRDFFKDLAIYTILMPLPQPIWDAGEPQKPRATGGMRFGGGNRVEAKEKDSGVRVLEAGVVGSLDYKILEAEKAQGLYDWLKENGYVYSGDTATLEFYIAKKWYFTVMKIDPKQMKKDAKGNYTGEVTPTRFTFASDKCVYPLKITQISVKDKTDALFYVQAASQMDLPGDLSWKHSYRSMYLTYVLGCSASEDQQAELEKRNKWVAEKMAKDPKFETTKLEWAKKLGDGEMAVLDDPLKNYGQMGLGAMPDGYKVVTIDELIESYKAAIKKNGGTPSEEQIKSLRERYAPEKGAIVKVRDAGKSWNGTEFEWYPNREAPAEDVKGLSRLKGHLQKGMWLTKFRKVLRKDEMTDDLELVGVQKEIEDEYVRIMPTSPP